MSEKTQHSHSSIGRPVGALVQQVVLIYAFLTSSISTVIYSICHYIFEKLFLSKITHGRLKIEVDGMETTYGESSIKGDQSIIEAMIIVKNKRFFFNVIYGQDVGFGESYVEGDFTTPNLSNLLKVLAMNNHVSNTRFSRLLSIVGFLYNRLKHVLKHNNIKNSKENIKYHYDLSNDMYRKFLDPTMTYSSGLFNNLDESTANLELAQNAKYDRIINELGITNKDRILEIGCGWGGFAIRAVKTTGCKVVGLSLSKQQLAYARELVERNGLSSQIELRYQDYRDVPKDDIFTKVVSIEMIEAVGHEYFDSYFKCISDHIRNGEKVMIQAILMMDNRYESYRSGCDFIQKYIFPGGLCPSLGVINKFGSKHDLIIDDVHNFGRDYAKTLRCWRESFTQNWDSIKSLGFDEKFYRMWIYYLIYCEVGFDLDLIRVSHIKLTKSVPYQF
ncbi:class I SAM-dependent methyltransferase [Yasminevirus sp. GU-2018]|uniref:Class I SAM-dependent methyltransferase n=1 Tax=Yasminevirus sp. GU-2018 TaxID=2420051 RepID=A0A5K0U800_9VIRU|nr:class I SAM-dependent methyltransferase [Yasminevirus sp. GU-2018]